MRKQNGQTKTRKNKRNKGQRPVAFRQFILDKQPTVMLYGVFNPPTAKLARVFEQVKTMASKGAAYAIISPNNNNTILDYATNIKFLRKMYPSHARSIKQYDDVTNIREAVNRTRTDKNVYVKVINMTNEVLESDAITEVISVAHPHDSTAMLSFVKQNNFDSFTKLLTDEFNEARNLFNTIRTALGLEPMYFGEKVNENSDSIREQYITDKIFKVGDVVQYKQQTKTIVERHTNHVTLCDGSNVFIRDLTII